MLRKPSSWMSRFIGILLICLTASCGDRMIGLEIINNSSEAIIVEVPGSREDNLPEIAPHSSLLVSGSIELHPEQDLIFKDAKTKKVLETRFTDRWDQKRRLDDSRFVYEYPLGSKPSP